MRLPQARDVGTDGRLRHAIVVPLAAMSIALAGEAVVAAPEPRAHVALTTHAAPKPLAAGAITEDWPGFLGPRRDGTSRETELLKDFPPDGPKLLWEMKRGTGYASPAVAGERVVFFHRIGDEEIVDCLQAETGRRFWRFAYSSRYVDRYRFGDGPRCTPEIHAGRVYTLGAEGKLHCLDLTSGAMIWKIDLREKYEIDPGFFGVGSTPLVADDRVYVNVGARGGPCVVAFDKKTGKVLWQAGAQWGMSYAAPSMADIHGKRRLIIFAGGKRDPAVGGLLVIDPDGGKIETRFPFRARRYESVNAANPVVFDNKVFLTTSYNTGSVLLELEPGGGFEVAWKNEVLESHFPTPIHRDGYLYGLHGASKHGTGVVCVNAATGEQVWENPATWRLMVGSGDETKAVPAGIFRGSLLFADGNFLTLGEDGALAWLDLSPDGYRELVRAQLFRASSTWSPPALSRGLLYVCQNDRDADANLPRRLLCYDLRRP